MARLKVAVLVSGRGSNLQALIDAAAAEDYPAEIALVISNEPRVRGLERAKLADIPTAVIDHRDFEEREDFERALIERLEASEVELVCLAGFMRILTPVFVEHWRDRLINIHPSLLPAFRGLNTHARAIDAGVRFTGATVHYVRAELDDGPIIVQAAVPVMPDDTEETLAERVLEAEHRIYPLAVSLFGDELLRPIGNAVKIAGDTVPGETSINPAGLKGEAGALDDGKTLSPSSLIGYMKAAIAPMTAPKDGKDGADKS